MENIQKHYVFIIQTWHFWYLWLCVQWSSILTIVKN